jgi:hypothetical protein
VEKARSIIQLGIVLNVYERHSLCVPDAFPTSSFAAVSHAHQAVSLKVEVFDPHSLAILELLSSKSNLLQEPWIVLKAIIEPIVFGREALQDPRRSAMTGDDYLFALGNPEVFGKVVFND